MNLYLVIRYRDNTLLVVPQEKIATMSSLKNTINSFAVSHNELIVGNSEENVIKSYKAKHGIED
jgi:hypothetical protein